jgi:hypothetical protein
MEVVNTLLLSAAVAAFVALLMEYAAKPWLEVRKESILAAHRDLRELRRRLAILGNHIVLAHRRMEKGDASQAADLVDTLIRETDELRDQMQVCLDTLPSDVKHLLALAIGEHEWSLGAAESVAKNSNLFTDEDRVTFAKTFLVREGESFALPWLYLGLPRRRWIKRHTVLRQIRRQAQRQQARLNQRTPNEQESEVKGLKQ